MLDRGKPFPGEKAGSTDPSGLNRTTFRNSVSPGLVELGITFVKVAYRSPLPSSATQMPRGPKNGAAPVVSNPAAKRNPGSSEPAGVTRIRGGTGCPLNRDNP